MSESPTKRPRLAADTPQGFLDAARQWYAPGPADPAMPAAATHTSATAIWRARSRLVFESYAAPWMGSVIDDMIVRCMAGL